MFKEWSYAGYKIPEKDVELLVCVEKEVCGAENDFISTDFFNGEYFDIYYESVYAWANLPEAYDPTKDNNEGWIVGFPENNGSYLVTLKVSDLSDNTDNFCIFVMEYEKEIYIDPWNLRFHYECDKEDDELGKYVYEYMAYMHLPKIAKKNG